MAAITTMTVRLATGNRSGAGTDGDIYVGICGRELSLDSQADDFEPGSNREYIFGQNSNIRFATENDPRSPQLDTADLDKFPVYLRFEPDDSEDKWNLEEVNVTVNPDSASSARYRAMGGAALNLWMGKDFGKYAYLKEV